MHQILSIGTQGVWAVQARLYALLDLLALKSQMGLLAMKDGR
jgi:hypothetical protein